jgi:hypothetical protein
MYYTAKVKFRVESPQGKLKWQRETYLVEADGVTDVEATITERFQDFQHDYELTGVTQSNIVDVYEKVLE